MRPPTLEDSLLALQAADRLAPLAAFSARGGAVRLDAGPGELAGLRFSMTVAAALRLRPSAEDPS